MGPPFLSQKVMGFKSVGVKIEKPHLSMLCHSILGTAVPAIRG